MYLLVTLTLRTGIYLGLRLSSGQKMFEWTFISPSVFYLTYATNLMIVVGVIYFIYSSAPLKKRYAGGVTDRPDSKSSIFPADRKSEATEGGVGAINNEAEAEDSGSVDGDALIRNRRRSSDSSDL